MKNILVIAHKDLVPPKNAREENLDRFKTPWVAEHDVIHALLKSGRRVETLGIDEEVGELIKTIKENKNLLVFNMLEQFNNDPAMDYHVVTLLELHRTIYTGCNSKGLLLGRDKALAKKILKYHKIATPKFFRLKVDEKLKASKKFNFPLIVKCALEEASYGLAQASVVRSFDKLKERVAYIQNDLGQEVIVEEFVEGREIYMGVIGNKRLKTLPAWELKYNNVESPEKEVYTERAKWNLKYRERKGIEHRRADISEELEKRIQKMAKRTYKALSLGGYARVDFRVDSKENIHVLEANPNPNIARDDEFAESAKYAGISYTKLIDMILKVSQKP